MAGSITAPKDMTIDIAGKFLAAAEEHAELPAAGMAGEDAYLSYEQLRKKILEAAIHLGELAPQEPVGLLSENRPEWGKIYLAILARGGVVVPVDAQLKREELTGVFRESGIKHLVVSERYYDVVGEIIDRMKLPIRLISLETIPEADISEFKPTFATDPDTPAVLIFTSGTTDKPKKVVLTHGNILSDIDGIIGRLAFGPGDRFLSVLPLHHTFEATCGFLTPLLHGCAVYYVKTLNSREIINGIEKHRITHFISVPLMYEKLYHGIMNGIKKAPAHKRVLIGVSLKTNQAVYKMTGANWGEKLFRRLREKAGLQTIRLMVSGGAPLPPEISRNFNLLGFNLVEGYGLTETSPVLSVNPIDKNKFGSVGPPLENVDTRIDQPDEKGVGELVVKGPMLTPGYRDNPEETARLLRDGWLHTGDMARIDEEGYIFIMGRKKNLIVSAAGKNIHPEEIESALLSCPYIMEAMVYGKKADSGREEVAAMIYPDFEALSGLLNKPPEKITDEETKAVMDREIRQVSGRLADYKRIKHVEYLHEELEKTSTKKIKRYKYQQ